MPRSSPASPAPPRSPRPTSCRSATRRPPRRRVRPRPWTWSASADWLGTASLRELVRARLLLADALAAEGPTAARSGGFPAQLTDVVSDAPTSPAPAAAPARSFAVASLEELYSNHGAALPGHIVATLSGVSFHDYTRAHIIDPLGLGIRTSSEGQTASDNWRHKYDQNGVPVAYLDDPTNDLGLASGGWKASAGGLVRLMLGTDRNSNHPDVLAPATLALMETKPYAKSSYALGWDTADGRLMKGGRLDGGTAHMSKFPADYFSAGSVPITVAVCTDISISDAMGGSSVLGTLAREIGEVVSEGVVSGSYDLY